MQKEHCAWERLNFADSNSKVLKKFNPSKAAIVGRKLGVFAPNRFSHFEHKAAQMKYSAFALCHKHPKLAVEVKNKILSKNSCQNS